MKLTKRKVKEILGIRTDVDLSKYFGLSRAAANFWPEDEEIPAEHRITLLQQRPELIQSVLGVEPKAA